MFSLGNRPRRTRPTKAFDKTQQKRAAKAPKPPAKTPGYLLFSEDVKEAAFGRGAGGMTGYKVAVTDNGGAFVCTNFVETKGEAEVYITKYDGDMQDVSDLRIVEEQDGKPVNQDRWDEWGYDPKKCVRNSVVRRDSSNYNTHGCFEQAMRNG